MRAVLALTVCVGVLLAATVARADLPEGAYAPAIEAEQWLNIEEFDEAPALRDLRGTVVVLFFWASFHQGGQNVMELMNIVESNRNLGRARGVIVIGLTEAARERVEDTLRKEKVFFPVGVESKAHEDYQIDSFPRVAVIDPAGKVAWTGSPGDTKDMVDAVRAVLDKTPPTKTHPLEASRCRECLERARDALRQKHYRAAFEAARDAYEHALTGDPLKTLCRDMLDLIEALGRDKLAEVDTLIDAQDFAQSVQTLRQLTARFRGLDVGKTAEQRLEAYGKQYPEVAELVRLDENTARARGVLFRAQENIKARRFGEGYEKLESIVAEYAGTEMAGRAGAILGRMQANETVMAHVRDHKASRDCQTWLSLARSYLRTRRAVEAKRLYRKIMDKYPDTSYALEARRELSKLP